MTKGFDFAAASGIPVTKDGTPDFAAAAGLVPNPDRNAPLGTADAKLFRQAAAKLKAGQSLTQVEAEAIARSTAAQRATAGIAWALQPLSVLSDITKGIASTVKTGNPQGLQRGLDAAGGHVLWGALEHLPGLAGARSRGVTGMELLRGTKYEGNPKAALAVELFSDPSLVLTGAGFLAKGAATAGRLTALEKIAQTPEGAALIREALKAANARGDALVQLGDEVTGVPALVRGAAKTAPVKAAKGKLADLATTQLPDFPGAAAIRREGGGTVGDAFLTPDQKKSIYSPEQLKNEEFRVGQRLGADNTAASIKTAAQADGKVAAAITKGLRVEDAAEVNRLLGVFTTTTDPAVAAEALRKLGVISSRVGQDLEPKFVAAVKAADRTGQKVLGAQLKAEGLPAVIDPVVTRAIQEAQTGADLAAQVGRYQTAAGRPRGILMTQYKGRDDVPAVIADLAKGPEIPASTTVDVPKTAQTVEAVAAQVPVPPKPVEPVGVPAQGELPRNAPGMAERLTQTPVSQTPPFVQGAARAPSEPVSPAEVMEALFTGKKVSDPIPPPAGAAPAPINPASAVQDFTPRTPAAVLDELLTAPPAPRVEPVQVDEVAPVPVAAVDDVLPTPPPTESLPPAAPLAATAKTPQSVLADLLAPPAPAQTVLPAAGFRPTEQAIAKTAALPSPAPEKLVYKDLPTTYRTVPADANALDWASLPDDAARRAVLNAIPDARNGRFIRDASGALRLDRANITVPLNHPTIGQYFPDDAIRAAQRQGTDLGELTVTRREQVPQWYDPKSGAPLETQRALREQAQREAQEAAYPNQYAAALANDEAHDFAWTLGDAFASVEKVARPAQVDARAASNAYAQRVLALTGRPATKGEVFRYRMQLARHRQARNFADLKGAEVATHLDEFFRANPDALLYDGVLSAARAFDLGTPAARELQQVLRRGENGIQRELSTIERAEFAQYLNRKDGAARGSGAGMLLDRLKRRPEPVSQEFLQVFEQDVNALNLLDEQVRTRTPAILKAAKFREYRAYLADTGQMIPTKRAAELRRTPESALSPEERVMRRNAATAVTRPGEKAGWYVVDSDIEGYFKKGDVIPWWAAFDLMPAKVVGDEAVAGATLGRGGLDVYNRLWSAMNARMLGSVSSVVNDQIGQFLQMAMWGVSPDAVLEGVVRRATAKPEELELMRESGIHSAKLEANLGATREELTRLAARLDGDTDLTRLQRVIDRVIRFTERGTGLNPTAMTGAAGVAADVASFGSGYVFQLRSAMSDLQRESLWFHRRALGDTPAQAAQYANDVLLDMRLVPAYARIVRKFWPFFNWIAMSGPRSVVTILRKPGINAAYQRLPRETDNPDDPKDDVRRMLARDGGWLNLGANERSGARVYLDPKNWSPVNTIPQLLDWRNTAVGAVDLPWYVNLTMTVQGGVDRFGRNIYASVLDGGTGGYAEAADKDPKAARMIAFRTVMAQFNPSYAPGSSRAQALVRSIVATAKLPEDGSRDIAIAKTLTQTEWGRAWLVGMQKGVPLMLADPDLLGARESEYSLPPTSMAVAAGAFALPLKTVQADQAQPGQALQALAVGQLEMGAWVSQQRRRLAELEAGGATPERLRAEEERMMLEGERRSARLDMLDRLTR